METAYLCDINKNTACKKTACIRNGGPCMATLDPKYAWKDIDGSPIVADDEEMNAAVELWIKKGRVSK